jgi:hypothetical protein
MPVKPIQGVSQSPGWWRLLQQSSHGSAGVYLTSHWQTRKQMFRKGLVLDLSIALGKSRYRTYIDTIINQNHHPYFSRNTSLTFCPRSWHFNRLLLLVWYVYPGQIRFKEPFLLRNHTQMLILSRVPHPSHPKTWRILCKVGRSTSWIDGHLMICME